MQIGVTMGVAVGVRALSVASRALTRERPSAALACLLSSTASHSLSPSAMDWQDTRSDSDSGSAWQGLRAAPQSSCRACVQRRRAHAGLACSSCSRRAA
eukprot:2082268-Pleurochrysis_carterae.AAC.1